MYDYLRLMRSKRTTEIPSISKYMGINTDSVGGD